MANTQEIFDALGLSKEEQAENELKAKIITALLDARKEKSKNTTGYSLPVITTNN